MINFWSEIDNCYMSLFLEHIKTLDLKKFQGKVQGNYCSPLANMISKTNTQISTCTWWKHQKKAKSSEQCNIEM